MYLISSRSKRAVVLFDAFKIHGPMPTPGYRRHSQEIGIADPPFSSSRGSSSTSTRFTPARLLSSAVTKVLITSSPFALIPAQ